jgi:hypothetical protein
MSEERYPVCQDEQKRTADLRAEAGGGGQPLFLLKGIDFIEVDPADHSRLEVFFLKPLAPANPADPNDPADALGITADLSRITVSGGIRIVGIKPLAAERRPDGHLHLELTSGGDFSTYVLTINVAGLDPLRGSIEFSFMASCPVEFDCRKEKRCPPKVLDELPLDYMAKDYASFRRMMLDLLPQLNPQFTERNPADLGITLVELLAYVGDNLSYFQDAAANEAYLDTVRQRISARRHARLVDYRMHDGRSAATWVHVAVSAPLPLAKGTRFVTRLYSPLASQTSLPGVIIDAARITAESMETDPALVSAVVFESFEIAQLDPRNNRITIHTWGERECCLAPGACEAFLYTVLPGSDTAVLPVLHKGDWLLLEDPDHRAVVQIEDEPAATEDPLYAETILAGDVRRRESGEPALPLLHVRWRREDALRFPLCLSARAAGQELVRDIGVARGNLVLADHGLTTIDTIPVTDAAPFRPRLSRGPMTIQESGPAVGLRAAFQTGDELWTPVPDLLDSPPFAQEFVAEVDDAGRAVLRFGDGEYGRDIAGAASLEATYRIGNGTAGNVGAHAIAHVALTPPVASVVAVRNPLAATGGVDAETIEEVRRRAPQAFRAEQFRAVTPADYVRAATKLPDVAGAFAAFRWTGSWYTVFVAIDPRDPRDLIRRPKGLAVLAPDFERRVRAFLTRYRLAGYDFAIRPPAFVPLEIELKVCASPDHFRADVTRAVLDALSNRAFFHPDNFTFGQSVYLSRVYAAVARVEGVESAEVLVFRRAGHVDNGELASGVLPIGPSEIAMLDNDPSFMENGVLRVETRGGKG